MIFFAAVKNCFKGLNADLAAHSAPLIGDRFRISAKRRVRLNGQGISETAPGEASKGLFVVGDMRKPQEFQK